MRKRSFVSLLMSFLVTCAIAAPGQKQLLRIEQAKSETLQRLVDCGAEIDQVRGLGSAIAWQPRGMAEVDVWLDGAERARLEAEGLRFVEIPDLAHEMWLAQQAIAREERLYHDHEALTAYLQGVAAAHPDICRLNSIGLSVQGRELWELTISDNPDLDEDEPEFRYISTMHGDEVVGEELMLYLIDEIVEGYGSVPRLTRIVDEVELHIMPLMNPDGNALGRRTNADYIDLNRNFPDPFTSPSNTPAGRAVETGLVMNWVASKNFTLSANFHGGAMLVNYPFDNNPSGSSVYTASPDDDLFIEMSEAYTVSNIPMWNGDFTHGISNGAEWYAVSGGMQDWNYRYEGGMEVTIELYDVKWPDFSAIPGLWDDNRESMLSYLEYCLRGVRGIVTSSATGDPLAGVEVRVVGRDHVLWTSPMIGDYHRIVPDGIWALEFSKPGYVTQTVSGISVSGDDATVVDVALVPLVAAPEFVLGAVTVPDANGALDPGETGPVQVMLVNGGTIDAHSVAVDLECLSPWVTVLHEVESIGAIGVDESVQLSLAVAVDPAAPLGENVEFTLVVASDELNASLPFSLSIGRVVEGFESGDFLAWPWTAGGNLPWTISSEAEVGDWCAASGAIGHNQDSQITLALNLVSSGTLSFDCRVSSESGYDYLKVYVDGSERLGLAGEVAWHTEQIALDAGEHSILFSYEKDGSVSNGSDRAWIDEIVMPPLAAIQIPCLTVSPLEIEADLAPGLQGEVQVLLENCGGTDVAWQAQLSLDDPARSLRDAEPAIKIPKGVEPLGVESDASRNGGGPDSFGYTWTDSNEAGGPAFNWVELSGLGDDVGSGDDANFGPFDLGFDFPFYGNTYSTIRIDTNGYLSFTSSSSAYSNATIPTSSGPNALLAPFWDDMDPSDGGTILAWADPAADRYVVQWDAVVHYGGANAESFQVVLEGDGRILFQYETVASSASCTVGIENATGTDGLQVLYNAAGVISSGLAIRIDPPVFETPWASLSASGGTIEVGEQQVLSVQLDATELLPGVYTGTVLLTSNDPAQASLELPLSLTVAVPSLDPVVDLVIDCEGGQVLLSWSAVTGQRSTASNAARNPIRASGPRRVRRRRPIGTVAPARTERAATA